MQKREQIDFTLKKLAECETKISEQYEQIKVSKDEKIKREKLKNSVKCVKEELIRAEATLLNLSDNKVNTLSRLDELNAGLSERKHLLDLVQHLLVQFRDSYASLSAFAKFETLVKQIKN